MVEILDSLAQILCPTPESLSSCQQFINEFAAQGPVQQLLFFLFFPTIFIILFIFILTRALPFLSGPDKALNGLRLLMAVAIYAFIIIQGWYAITLALSRFWFVAIIVIGGLWFFVTRHFRGSERGGLVGVGGGGGLLGYAGKRIAGKISKYEEDTERRIRDGISELKGIKNQIEHGTPEAGARAWASYQPLKQAVLNEIQNLRAQLGMDTQIGRVALETGKIKKYLDEVTHISKEIEKTHTKKA